MAYVSDLPESWRDIPGFPGYQISTLGRVKSLARRVPRAQFGGFMRVQERIMKLTLGTSGYPNVTLAGTELCFVHPLVLLAFVGPKTTPRHQGAHGNGIRDDNRLSNLRWATPKENQHDRILHGTDQAGEKAPWAKLTWEAVAVIRSFGNLRDGRALRLAEQFGVSAAAIYHVAKRETWKGRPPPDCEVL